MKFLIFAALFLNLLMIVPVQAAELTPRLEPLLGVFSTSTGIELFVESGGCTDANSFKVSKNMDRETIQIFFIRVVADTCLGLFREGQSVSYSFEDLGLKAGDRFQIMNQIQVLESM